MAVLGKELGIAFADADGFAVFAYLRQKLRDLPCPDSKPKAEPVGEYQAAFFGAALI